MREQRIGVIGAGPCGLAVCKTLDEFGIDYECLETGHDVGGMDYTGLPFPADAPPYPTAAEMLDYFRSYAERFGVMEQIRFGTRVRHARPLDEGGWQLELSSGELREYSSLVVATGQYNHPRRPHDQTPGHFSGETLHVFDYLDAATPVDCRDRRVVVVGLGSSAAELAAELSDPDAPAGSARQVLVSARSGRWVLPKTLRCEAPDLALYQRIVHPRHADLFFVGCCRVMCSMWPLAEQQSRWIARLLTGAFSLPDRAGRTRKAVPLASSLPVMCGFYVEALRREAGGLKPP